jgi:hypothetical protein
LLAAKGVSLSCRWYNADEPVKRLGFFVFRQAQVESLMLSLSKHGCVDVMDASIDSLG